MRDTYNKIEEALFLAEQTLTYSEVTVAITELANLIINTDEEIDWYMCEGNRACSACLGDIITGAYWFYTDFHAGQTSPEYAALCALGEIFNPGYCSGVEKNTCEADVYKELEYLLNEE
jgi:hypothetical protein